MRPYATAALAGLALAVALGGAAPAAARTDALRAGAGRADITPPTGYPMLGWARGDARAVGQSTRLFARAIVLARGARRLALVAADFNAIPGGVAQQAALRAGFRVREVLISASHTHAGPTGFANFDFKNTAVPAGPVPGSEVSAPDPVLYGFMVRRLATALRRARRDLAPAAAAWGAGRLLGVTANRSLEAHLADHGLDVPRGSGRVGQDPAGYPHTIDPAVDVLRVDRVAGGRRTPLGAWSAFANHGTVNKASFRFYNADHHAAAARVFEAAVRRQGRVPAGREVVNVYGNGAAGDISAGLRRSGPAAADAVGRREAAAMLAAWRSAGARLRRDLPLAARWTRVCFCGQPTPAGRLADHAVFGRGYFTGSEEGRGPLFDATGQILEGERAPFPDPVQGYKSFGRSDDDRTLEPVAVPLTAARIGDRLVVTVPGEATAQLGRRARAAALAARVPGVRRAVVAGYANEYASYFTTPEEYGRQHYEGATTVFGPASGPFVVASLGELAARLARRAPAPAPHPFDPTRGLRPGRGAYPPGARRARALTQPRPVARLERAVFRWRGGAAGTDRPLDRPFVRVERRARGGWRTVDTDLGLRMLWRVDDDRPKLRGMPRFTAGERGTYGVQWEAPAFAPLGLHRFVVTARRYRLVSRPFALRPSVALRVVLARAGDRLTVRLAYPPAVEGRDLTARGPFARGGRVLVRAGGRTLAAVVRSGRASPAVPAGAAVTVPAGAARDEHGNRNARGVSIAAASSSPRP
jgi:hypothetical protein